MESKIDLTNLETAELIKWIKDIYGLLRVCKINSRPKNLPLSHFIQSAAFPCYSVLSVEGRRGWLCVCVNTIRVFSCVSGHVCAVRWKDEISLLYVAFSHLHSSACPFTWSAVLQSLRAQHVYDIRVNTNNLVECAHLTWTHEGV